MEKLFLSLLLMMSQLEGITDAPSAVPSDWHSSNHWEQENATPVFTAESSEIVQKCKENRSGYVKFPTVIYGAHEIFLDGHKLIEFGDPSMNRANFVMSAPVLECHSVLDAKVLTWKVYGYSRYFARVSHYPRFQLSKPATRFFGETLYIGSSLGLLILLVFSMSILLGKESRQLIVAISGGILGMVAYQISLIGPAFEIGLPMLTMHRLGDLGLLLGIYSVIASFFLEGLIPKRVMHAHSIATLASFPFMLLGSTGDTIQFGTSIPMLTVLISVGIAAKNLGSRIVSRFSWETVMTATFGAIFFAVTTNDILVCTGSHNGITLMSVGPLVAFLILLLGVNQRISATYRERDFLRANLEAEVERKTFELTRKTTELESAMASLRSTQAELVQSAKLASLGTLAAGIAHEINNSVNYVNGALQPLEKIVRKHLQEDEVKKVDRLFGVMREGLDLTIEIIKSLRNYTGLNQAKFNDVNILKTAQGTLNIVRSRIRGHIEVKLDVPEDLTVFGSVVGLNQIFMNLITNAIDAMPSGGTLTIEASVVPDREQRRFAEIRVRDTGSGIPPETAARIFEPFFTTKAVGSGTGLGLHIVLGEIKRHNGEIKVESEVGRGTCFMLRLPCEDVSLSQKPEDLARKTA